MKEPTEIFKYEGRAVKFFLDGKVANERRGEYLKLIRVRTLITARLSLLFIPFRLTVVGS